MTEAETFPIIRTVGLDGMLVTFSDRMSDAANRAALAFRDAVEQAGWPSIIETSSSLASTYLRFDPLELPHAEVEARLADLLAGQNWYAAALPPKRHLWRIPTVYGTDLAPQLDEAAALAGLSVENAVERLGTARVRVLTIGFAPGQPYLGPLGPEFDIPRQTDLTPTVPRGALVLAISQFVLFSGPAPTGWRHVGQTAFSCFRPDMPSPFSLRPGDEVIFEPVTQAELERIIHADERRDSNGGARCEVIDT
ncbi:MAG: allophanate hydrolase subunit 1 [Pseudomonadota bacterium]